MRIRKFFRENKFFAEVGRKYFYRYVLVFMLTLLLTSMGLTQIYIMRIVIDDGILASNWYMLVRYVVIIIGLFIITQLVIIVKTVILTKMKHKILMEFRLKLYDMIMSKEISFYGFKNVGELITRIMEEVPIIVNFCVSTTLDFLTTIFTVSLLLIIMFQLSFILTIITVFSLIIIFFLMKYFGEKIKALQERSLAKYSEVSNVLYENLQNVKTIKYLRKYKYSHLKLKKTTNEHIGVSLEIMKVSITLNFIVSIFNFLPNITLFSIGGYLVIKGVLTLGIIVVMMNYLGQFIQSVQGLSSIHIKYQKFKVSLHRFNTIINVENDDKIATRAILTVKNISFNNISFSYSENLITDLTHKIELGSIVKINGNNGKGKSTLANLICGLIKPDSGCICINDINIDEIEDESLGKHIGIVPQEIQLFTSRVIENILLGDRITQEDILQLCKQIGFDRFDSDFIASHIHRGGLNVSGGMKQKIGVVRALVRKPEILILDEADLSLDKKSKEGLYKYLESTKQSRIALIISHDLIPGIEDDTHLDF